MNDTEVTPLLSEVVKDAHSKDEENTQSSSNVDNSTNKELNPFVHRYEIKTNYTKLKVYLE